MNMHITQEAKGQPWEKHEGKADNFSTYWPKNTQLTLSFSGRVHG